MRALTQIVVHHSASSRDTTTVEQIDRVHRARGWQGCGYHFVITGEGVIHATRPVSMIGAHVKGHNANTIGVCVTGDNTRPGQRWSQAQVRSLLHCIDMLQEVYPYLLVVGHKDLAPTLCPGLDIETVLTSGQMPPDLKEKTMSMPTVATSPREASSPTFGGIRDSIKIALLALLLKYLPQEMADQTAALIAGAVAGLLTFAGKTLRNWLDSGNAPGWLKLVGKLLPF